VRSKIINLTKSKITPVMSSDINKKFNKTPTYSLNKEIIPFKVEITPEYKRAHNVLKKGCPLVFITGKAGTGKSTFIQYFRNITKKRVAVLAPTGVAALNVNGQTIHSFFHFPPKVIDEDDIKVVFNRTLYEKLEILIVDEASMIRADILDGIDNFLRLNSLYPQKPFGGVQIVLVGDLFQLPPVANFQEAEILKLRGYETPYFYGAHCIQFLELAFIELTKIYRQENEHFIELLNCIREKKNIKETIEEINLNCCQENKDYETKNNIILTCTNNRASRLNNFKLNEILKPEKMFEGEIEGLFDIQKEKLPSPYSLRLKEGAQVMFTKNDSKRNWVNGTLGEVVKIDSDCISVRVKDQLYDVQKVSWEKYEYIYDEDTDKIASKVKGKYIQYPLMLAWAITIHKSQGKTLKNVYIDLGNGAFEFGQLYVALSRCPTIDDITLHKPISIDDVKVDKDIVELYKQIREKMKE